MKLRLLLALVFTTALRAASLDDATAQAKVDARVSEIKVWAADPVIVAAVKAHNAAVPPEHAALTQDKWKALSVLDPLVRAFSKNEAGMFLKTKKAEWITEAFLSDAHGLKVGFLAKTSNWSHAGKPKHDEPMAGKTWQGTVEVDESSGLQQLQVSVPVIDEGKPIGSLVVGLSLPKI
jgi:hypothetical protein